MFTRSDGVRPAHPDTVRKCGLQRAVDAAGLNQPRNRGCASTISGTPYASLLIAQGVNVAFASRQLGHASVSTTLNVYTHPFDHAEHAAVVTERLEARFATALAQSTGSGTAPAAGNLAILPMPDEHL